MRKRGHLLRCERRYCAFDRRRVGGAPLNCFDTGYILDCLGRAPDAFDGGPVAQPDINGSDPFPRTVKKPLSIRFFAKHELFACPCDRSARLPAADPEAHIVAILLCGVTGNGL